jgi:flagellar protein FliO/FliZ
MDSLLGAEMPLAAKFFLAFIVVLGLILGIAWALRRFGSGAFRDNARGRQPRLAVIDHASVDGRRRLILVRRDNVEHLLMIGGPTDVVVEPNIVRAVASPRDVVATRPPAGIEALPRAIPLPENGGSWPLQPEPAAVGPALSPGLGPSVGSRPSPRIEPLPDELTPSRVPQAEIESARMPPPRPQRDTLSALADELGSRPAPPPRRSPLGRPQPAEPRAEAKAEPQIDMPDEPAIAPAPPPPPPAPPAAADADQSLADMASRLEAALRKPSAPPQAEPRRPSPPPQRADRPAQAAEPADTLPPLPPRAPRPNEPRSAEPRAAEPRSTEPRAAEGKPARPDAKPNQGKTALYDSLEQEMASLLGRPTKT